MRRLIGLCFVFLPVAGVPAADNAAVPVLTVEAAISHALQSNRGLQAADAAVAEAEAARRYAGRPGNPELAVAYRDDRFGNDEGETALELELRQPLPLGGRLDREKSLQALVLEQALEMRRVQRLDLAHAVEQAMLRARLSDLRLETRRKMVDANRDMISMLQRQADRGEASGLDVIQAELAGRHLEGDVAELEIERRNLYAAVKRLLFLPAETELSLEVDLTLPDRWPPGPGLSGNTAAREAGAEAGSGAAVENRPAYRAQVLATVIADLRRELEQSRRLGDAGLSLFVEREEAVDAPDGLEANTLAGVGLSLPLPLLDRNREAVLRADAERAAAEARREAVRAEMVSAYHDTGLNARDAYHLAVSCRDGLATLAEENFNRLKAACEQGLAGLGQVQRAQEQVLAAHARTLQTLEQYLLLRSDLRRMQADYPVNLE